MSNLIAGRPPGGAHPGGGGPANDDRPPAVLLGALAVAALIGTVLFFLFGRFGGGSDDSGRAVPVRDADSAPAVAPPPRERVALTVTLLGGGSGVIQIQPGDIACIESCEHEFDRGTRVTVTAEPATGSTFDAWGDACDGDGRCRIVMDRPRALDATFVTEATDPADSGDPLCDPDLAAPDDPACAEDDLDAGGEDLDPGDDDLGAPPAPSCSDGRDNDRDGLTDAGQDPDCSGGGAEGAAPASPGAPPPPPPPPPPPRAARSNCSDGRDNDADGLTDRAQDPDCVGGRSEGG